MIKESLSQQISDGTKAINTYLLTTITTLLSNSVSNIR